MLYLRKAYYFLEGESDGHVEICVSLYIEK